MDGWIYRIHHQEEETGKNWFEEKSYVGQTKIAGGIKARFRQHVRACEKKKESSKKRTGKMAKLHDAMRMHGTSNFQIVQLEHIQRDDEHELQKALNQQELYWQEQFQSVDRGWNKVNAPKPSINKKLLTSKSLAAPAKEENVAYTSLLHRTKKFNETPEQAVVHLKNLKTEPITVYRYGRQVFESYKKLSNSRYNRNSVNHKTIEQRVRTLLKNGDIKLAEEDGKIIIDLVDSVFDAVEENKYQIQLRDGTKIDGSIKDIYDELRENQQYQENLPAYSTVVSRLNKEKQGKIAWSAQQAFGLDFPPNLSFAKNLIENEGYKFFPEMPNFNRLRNCIPIILEPKKEIFESQKIFCETYKIQQDQFSDLKKKGLSVEKILEYLDIKPLQTSNGLLTFDC